MLKNIFLIVNSIFLLVSCAPFNVGDHKESNVSINSSISLPIEPESLLEFSDERVFFSINEKKGYEQMVDWLRGDVPNKIELLCQKNTAQCMKVKNYFDSRHLSYNYADNKTNSVILFYHNITARKCDEYMEKNASNNLLSLGCATSSNILAMIKNYKQFITPEKLGPRDATSAILNYNNFNLINIQNME